MKKIIILLIGVVFGLSLVTQPAFAGSKQRYLWQGVAIGAGAVILGHAIVNSCNEGTSCKKVTVYNHPCPPPVHHGYWEIRKVWVEPKYKRVWKAGHYNCRSRRVIGRWQMVEKVPGHWKEQEVWIAGR
jgi:hypothetical protein